MDQEIKVIKKQEIINNKPREVTYWIGFYEGFQSFGFNCSEKSAEKLLKKLQKILTPTPAIK